MALPALLVAFAQTPDSAVISTNNFAAKFYADGTIASKSVGVKFTVPKDSGANALFAANLWIGGFDDTYGVLHISSGTYDDSLTNYRYGPIGNSYNAAYAQRYNKVWKVKQSDIDYHKIHWKDLGYTTPADILSWPGNGNTGNGEPLLLAPFEDKNGNFQYEPLSGETPIIRGDEALYIIYSDRGNVDHVKYGNPLNMDVHLMVYAYENPADTDLYNTLFCHYNIVNRSNEGYHDVLIGSWNDFDLGCFSNDRVGCDTVLNSFFVYNGTTSDIDCQGVKGYGYSKPNLGVTFLNSELHSFAYFTNGAPWNMADPKNPFQQYNYMDAIWPDGTHFNENSGYMGDSLTNFLFPGNPCDSSTWSELYYFLNLPAGDRRALGSTGKFNLPAGGSKCVDLAYVFATGNPQAACIADGVDSLKERIQRVQSFYNATTAACHSFNTGVQELSENTLQLYPNPANEVVTVLAGEQNIAQLTVTDVNGRVIYHTQNTGAPTHRINTAGFSAGLYFLSAQSGGKTFYGKLVVNR
jgi:hypothetical protein